MANQLRLVPDNEFDLKLGVALKEEGLERAATAREDVLALARAGCVKAALFRNQRGLPCVATADDAARFLRAYGVDPDAFGNAAGSLFRGRRWEFTGEWRKSRRTSNHARAIRVWRYVGPV